MVCLGCCILLMWVIDHYRMLRVTASTLHLTPTLSVAFSYWWAVPSGCLASVAVHWWHNAKWLTQASLAVSLAYALAGHCAVYVFTLRYIERRVKESSVAPKG